MVVSPDDLGLAGSHLGPPLEQNTPGISPLEQNTPGISGMVFLQAGCRSCHQPSVSKHWRKHKAPTLISGRASSFLHPQLHCWWIGCCSFYISSPMPIGVHTC